MERMKRKERKKIKKDKEAKINGKLVCVKGATILYVYLCTVCVCRSGGGGGVSSITGQMLGCGGCWWKWG